MHTGHKLALLALATLATFAVHHVSQFKSIHLEASQDNLFQTYVQWKSDYNQNFNGVEEDYRFSVFKANFELIEKFNAEQAQQNGSDLKLGLGPFTALTLEEYKERHVGNLVESESEEVEFLSTSPNAAYSTIDWRQKGAVNPVENQGACGSCWAFSTKGTLEGLNAVTNGVLKPLSAQQLVDCSQRYGNMGCNGGDLMAALRYTQAKGVELQSDYPYVSGTTQKAGRCQYNADKVAFQNHGQIKIARPNQEKIYQALTHQPLAIEVSAGNNIFQHYHSGIVKASAGCPTRLDHGVLLAGYFAEGNYWLIKNSWGTSWGVGGYINLEAQTSGRGTCGIQQYISYGTV